MSDTQGNESVEEITTAPIPSENKPTEASEPTLPDGVAERTKAEFEKLKQHNAQLKAENEAYKSKTSVLDDLRPSTIPEIPVFQEEQQTTSQEFVDENGYVDVAKIAERLKIAEDRAKKAEEKAQKIESTIKWKEENEQVQLAHKEFPQLNPKSENFDPRFYEMVRNELVGQMMNGKQDLLEAAKKVQGLLPTAPIDVSQVKQQAVDEYKDKSSKRSNATETPQGSAKQPALDRDELARRTREGDTDALYKRLQASGN